MKAPGQPTFYYDFNSPYAWLAAERINHALPVIPEWQPISYSHVVKHTGVAPWSVKEGREKQMREIDERAVKRGLPKPRWIEGWPTETVPMPGLRAAIFAQQAGRAVAFSLAAFRQMFAAGRSMADV